jgi:hypothetical protein
MFSARDVEGVLDKGKIRSVRSLLTATTLEMDDGMDEVPNDSSVGGIESLGGTAATDEMTTMTSDETAATDEMTTMTSDGTAATDDLMTMTISATYHGARGVNVVLVKTTILEEEDFSSSRSRCTHGQLRPS